MSIAVSTVVQPSRVLTLLTAGMCLLVLSVGCLIGLGLVGELGLAIRGALGGFCIFLSLFVCYRTVQNRKAHHIDISGHGQIRLTEHSALAGNSMNGKMRVHRGNPGQNAGESVSLIAESTMWSTVLLLRLQTEDQRVIVLPVLPDSVEGGGFRTLAVACRWIAAHNNPTDHTRL